MFHKSLRVIWLPTTDPSLRCFAETLNLVIHVTAGSGFLVAHLWSHSDVKKASGMDDPL